MNQETVERPVPRKHPSPEPVGDFNECKVHRGHYFHGEQCDICAHQMEQKRIVESVEETA